MRITLVFSCIAILLLTPTAPAQMCSNAPSGLVAWWRAEGNPADSVGSNHGVLLNGAAYSSGRVGQAFSFSALNHSVRITDAPALNPTNGMTLEGWVWVSQYPANDGVVVAGKDAPFAQRQYMIALNWTGSRWSFRPHVGLASGLKYFDGAASVQVGTWYHVAMTHDNATLRLYVNGVLDGSIPAAGAILPTPNPMNIAGFGVSPWTLLGKVDELSLYNRALSQSEIGSVFGAGSSGKCDPAVTNHAPVAKIVVSPLTQLLGITNNVVVAAICNNGTVILDGSQSSDADGDPLTYQWTEGAITLGTAVIITNQLASGTHEITLTVRDGRDSGTLTATVEVVTPAQSLGIIIAFLDDSVLDRRDAFPLIASLKAAAASFDHCRTIPGVNQLEAFQGKVQAQIAPQDADLAASLIEAAQQIIDSVQRAP